MLMCQFEFDQSRHDTLDRIGIVGRPEKHGKDGRNGKTGKIGRMIRIGRRVIMVRINCVGRIGMVGRVVVNILQKPTFVTE